MPDDHSSDTRTKSAVKAGGSVTGEIETAGDRDWFAVTPEAGPTYRFDLKGQDTGEGTLANPYLIGIHDANGARIHGARNNNGGEGRNSRVVLTADKDGAYHVVTGSVGDDTGTGPTRYRWKSTQMACDVARGGHAARRPARLPSTPPTGEMQWIA